MTSTSDEPYNRFMFHVGELEMEPSTCPWPEEKQEWVANKARALTMEHKSWRQSEIAAEYDRLHAEGKA